MRGAFLPTYSTPSPAHVLTHSLAYPPAHPRTHLLTHLPIAYYRQGLACVECHRAKAACQGYPCTRCVRLGKVCVPREKHKRRRVARTSDRQLSPGMHDDDELSLIHI